MHARRSISILPRKASQERSRLPPPPGPAPLPPALLSPLLVPKPGSLIVPPEPELPVVGLLLTTGAIWCRHEAVAARALMDCRLQAEN
jgi:hypothetical protein